MCMCDPHPNINGQPGYSWDGKTIGIRPVNPPPLGEHDVLLYDGPGRCGGLDSHCHHFRIVKRHGSHFLLVRHGGGDERLPLGGNGLAERLLALDDTACYWMLQGIHSAVHRAASDARMIERQTWMKAASEKRIRSRKQRDGHVKVWIETALASA